MRVGAEWGQGSKVGGCSAESADVIMTLHALLLAVDSSDVPRVSAAASPDIINAVDEV